MSRLVIPGDSLDAAPAGTKVTIGPGIHKKPQSQEIVPTSAGILNVKDNKSQTNRLVFLDLNSKRYIPQVNDYVIGIISGVYGEFYKVQLQDFLTAVQLLMMAFPNATKKNRPNLKVGQAVYARVSQAIPEIDTELECVDPQLGKDGGFGLLDESGYIFDINLNFARELLFNRNLVFLERLSRKCKFEIAVGINGKIWLKCGDGIKTNAEDDVVEEKDEEKIKKDNSSLVRDLKTTLAALRFLTICQKITVDKVDDELNAAFRNI